ncbi:hypothetical protein [Pseudomonas costantinii]|uniref:Uncharacterized protein n=1 Tax=Pseudomonas costantinii TaxID=168469 RepID=A0A1S2UHL8_9PSED|nr:hypothetical protein [Pseudomonas costantinii]OIN45957.1 hypothetical protein BFL40_27355 [Pseudomonas costantinii]SEE54496.1 hypothetical protein SAMN04515675_6158 [Pseudomonas costantinii]
MHPNDPFIPFAHIYIAIDLKDFNTCKVGLTTSQNPLNRIRAGRTSNPYYVPFVSYNLGQLGIGKAELKDFERYLHRKISDRVPFADGDFESEWLTTSPIYTNAQVIHHIVNGFRKDGEDAYFFNDDGDIRLDRLGEIRTYYSYSAQDLTKKFGDKVHPQYLEHFSCKF